MDMSLDDIIKTKKIGPQPSKKFGMKKNIQSLNKSLNKLSFKPKPQIVDARLKIIQKNRAKIRDARDKLAEITRTNGDARQRLLQRQKSTLSQRNGKANYVEVRPARLPVRTTHNPARPKVRQIRNSNGMRGIAAQIPELIDVPRGYVDYDNMERMEEEEFAVATRLSRTVKNDVAPYEQYNKRPEQMSPPPPPRRINSWNSNSEHHDPFDVYEVPISRRERRISPEMSMPPKGILRPSMQHSPVESYSRRFPSDNATHLSYEMRTRLERAPDPHASMGIFSNPLKASQASVNGFRIVVSNLHTSVTQSDIQELFEDIGPLYDSRIVRPGVAEVVYKSLVDAEKAVDTYHNRKLDGQPMKCLLVNPRASNKPTAPAIKTSSNSSYSSGKSPVEIDIDALHKVLFQRH